MTELQTVETLNCLIERTETPPFYRLTSMRKASSHSDGKMNVHNKYTSRYLPTNKIRAYSCYVNNSLNKDTQRSENSIFIYPMNLHIQGINIH